MSIFILLGKRETDGEVGVYTGKAGDGWFSEDLSHAFKMSRELSDKRLAQFAANKSLHRIEWQIVEIVNVTGGVA